MQRLCKHLNEELRKSVFESNGGNYVTLVIGGLSRADVQRNDLLSEFVCDSTDWKSGVLLQKP